MRKFETTRFQPISTLWRRSLAGAAICCLMAAAPGASAETQELVFSGFGGSLQKALQATVIPAFEKKYDAKVVYVSGTSNQILAKVRAQKNALKSM